MGRTTIAIQSETRARLKAQAECEDLTIEGLLKKLLDEHEQRQFWGSFAELTPEGYSAALAEDGDLVDQHFEVEDAVIDSDAV